MNNVRYEVMLIYTPLPCTANAGHHRYYIATAAEVISKGNAWERRSYCESV